ncbi:MAG: sulfatase/phosphatase domain-containing protein [Pleurocapsa sp.]
MLLLQFAQQYQNITVPRYQSEGTARSLPEFLQNSEAQLTYKQLFVNEELYQKSVKNYYRLISGIDESVGRIVRAVKQQNFAQDTYIIFTSDNGFFLGEKGLAGKWFGFEPAIRTPLIISSLKNPVLTPQKVIKMTLNIDVAPTVLALGQVDLENKLFHGNSMINEQNAREWWFYEHLFEHPRIPMNVGIRSTRYKYLSFPQHDYEMLFDLNLDPQENINLAYENSYRAIAEKYRSLVQDSVQNLS